MKVKFVNIYNNIYFGIKTIEGRQIFFLRFPRCIFLDKRWQGFNSEYENTVFDSLSKLKEFIRKNDAFLEIDAEELIEKLDNKIEIIKKENSLENKEKQRKLLGWWI